MCGGIVSRRRAVGRSSRVGCSFGSKLSASSTVSMPPGWGGGMRRCRLLYNRRHWLSTFLQACAENGGTCPTDLSAFLPWHMTPERREELARPAPVMLSPLTPGAQAEEETEAVDTS